MKNAILPSTAVIVVDDVGWHNGADMRHANQPARSGLPRFHHPDDVRALGEIGRGLNMHIICSLVLGEWDRKNILRGVPHVTGDEQGWDAAAKLDPEYGRAYFEALEECEYLDYAVHGLCHAYYENGHLVTARQYYPDVRDENGNRTGFKWLPEEEFARMIDLFLEIYNDWGFKKEIKTFVSPCGCLGKPTDEGNLAYARVLRDRGIDYWCNGWAHHPTLSDTVGGLMTTRSYSVVPWNAYDVDPTYLRVFGEDEIGGANVCFHLTNFIRYNHEKNFEYVPAWIDYFKRQSEVFGFMLARNIGECSTQAIYKNYATLTETDTGLTLDLTAADDRGANALGDELYLSLRRGTEPATCLGGEISLYEEKQGFNTYKIKRSGDALVEITYK